MKWTTQQRAIGELIPTDYNPRYLTNKQKTDLQTSIERFNLAEIPAINITNQIIAGHQRIRILYELYGAEHVIDVRVPDRQLSDEEVREYLIRSNKNTGSWDWDALANNFDLDDLTEWGFEEEELFGKDPKPPPEIKEEDCVLQVICTDDLDRQDTMENLTNLGYSCRIPTKP